MGPLGTWSFMSYSVWGLSQEPKGVCDVFWESLGQGLFQVVIIMFNVHGDGHRYHTMVMVMVMVMVTILWSIDKGIELLSVVKFKSATAGKKCGSLGKHISVLFLYLFSLVPILVLKIAGNICQQQHNKCAVGAALKLCDSGRDVATGRKHSHRQSTLTTTVWFNLVILHPLDLPDCK